MNTDDLLKQMELYGKPVIGKYDSGWYCCCNMLVTGKGVEFKIASDFGNKTPLNAAQECYDRMTDALASLNNNITISEERKKLT